MSSRVLATVPNAIGQKQAQIVYGEVSMTKPAPTSFSSPLYVVVPDHSTDFYWTVTNWPACHGSTLPAQGAACMLIWDNQGTLRCVDWSGPTPSAASTTGTTTGYTTGTGTAVTVDGKTTGGVGTTAYTLGDIVLALKQLGLLHL